MLRAFGEDKRYERVLIEDACYSFKFQSEIAHSIEATKTAVAFSRGAADEKLFCEVSDVA